MQKMVADSFKFWISSLCLFSFYWFSFVSTSFFQLTNQNPVGCRFGGCYGRIPLSRYQTLFSLSASAAAKSLQSCPSLCDPIDGSPLGSPIPGILQTRTLEWAAISFSNAWKWKVKVKSLSRVDSQRPMDSSLLGSFVHGIFQARVLEWVATAFSISLSTAAAAKSLQSCPTLCNPIDGSPPGTPVPGSLQTRTLEWAALSFSNAWKWKVKSESEVAQPCQTPSDPMDCSLQGCSIHGIFQARVREWGAIQAKRPLI